MTAEPRDRNCTDCGKGITRQSKTGVCLGCFNRRLNSDPEIAAKRKAGLAKRWEDPRHVAKMQAVARRMGVEARKDPEFLEWQRQNGKRLFREVLSRPDVVAKTVSKEARLKAANKKRETAIAWCPEEYREQFHFLHRNKRIKFSEAQELILAQVKADRERAAKLSPFERQMRALENGAKLVANDRKPSLADPGYYEERKAG